MLVRESLKFQRGQEPSRAMDLGNWFTDESSDYWKEDLGWRTDHEKQAAANFNYNGITVKKVYYAMEDDYNGEANIEFSNGDTIEYWCRESRTPPENSTQTTPPFYSMGIKIKHNGKVTKIQNDDFELDDAIIPTILRYYKKLLEKSDQSSSKFQNLSDEEIKEFIKESAEFFQHLEIKLDTNLDDILKGIYELGSKLGIRD